LQNAQVVYIVGLLCYSPSIRSKSFVFDTISSYLVTAEENRSENSYHDSSDEYRLLQYFSDITVSALRIHNMIRKKISLRWKDASSGLSLLFATLCIIDIFGVFPIIALPRAIVQCGELFFAISWNCEIVAIEISFS